MINWKTTLFGWLTGAGYTFLAALQSGLKPKDAALGIGIGILGTLAKDFNVTGGTKQQ
jgi:hypothetical protein